MDAELFAIGPYHPDLSNALGYPPDYYRDTPEDATIITEVASCCNTEGSKGLAQALGIDPWAFEQHCNISGEDADLELFAESVEDGDNAVVCFLMLRERGFRFFYMPRG